MAIPDIQEGGAVGYSFDLHNTLEGDVGELNRILRNNIFYDDEIGPIKINTGAVYTHSNNTWDSEVTLSSADFAGSLDSATIATALLAPRQSDGSLPVFNHLKLASGSDLIDAGLDVGLPYNGSAPDLGAFESNYGRYIPRVNASGKILINSSGKPLYIQE